MLRRGTWATRIGLVAAIVAGAPASAGAEPARGGGQVEAFAGGSFCIDGRVGCSRTSLPVTGGMEPSFGGGLGLGVRPRPWILIAALYRAGRFDPDYADVGREVYDAVVQHTIAVAVRPILPVWRFDLGLGLGVGYSRQAADYREPGRRDFTQGVTLVSGITADAFVTDHVFAGVGVDVLINLHGAVCRRTYIASDCGRASGRVALTPNHQVLFGLRIGTTFG